MEAEPFPAAILLGSLLFFPRIPNIAGLCFEFL
jgi:hypothetical protein